MKKTIFLFIMLFTVKVLASTSTIVMDTNTHRILYESNAYERKLIASTTKIMTFVIAYEYAKDFLELEIAAGEEILKMYGTSIYLSYKEKMKLKDLLYGLMLRSGNDAAEVIANFVGGSEEGFVKLMNKKAKVLGMNNTIFHNPHGLDENTQNYSTAYDMALLSSYAAQIPFYRQVTSTKYYQVQTKEKAYSWTNRNHFVFTYPYYTSGKTGYTPSAGRTFVTTAKKDNFELTIVTLNDDNMYERHRTLYEEMFNIYANYRILSKDDFTLINPDYYLKKDIYYPLTKEERKKIDLKIFFPQKENNLGRVIVSLNNKEVIEERIFLKDDKNNKEKRQSFWQKALEFLQNIF